jgi:hypothetical protein
MPGHDRATLRFPSGLRCDGPDLTLHTVLLTPKIDIRQFGECDGPDLTLHTVLAMDAPDGGRFLPRKSLLAAARQGVFSAILAGVDHSVLSLQ